MNLTAFSEHLLILLPPLLLSFVCTIAGSLWINRLYRQEKDEDNGRFRYYYFTDLSDKKDFDYFVEHVKMNALYDTGVDAEWGDELLTLSTCSYHVTNGRFVVVAKRIKQTGE